MSSEQTTQKSTKSEEEKYVTIRMTEKDYKRVLYLISRDQKKREYQRNYMRKYNKNRNKTDRKRNKPTSVTDVKINVVSK